MCLLLLLLPPITGPGRSLGLELSDKRVYAPQMRARLGTTAHFCQVVVLELRAHHGGHSLFFFSIMTFEPKEE